MLFVAIYDKFDFVNLSTIDFNSRVVVFLCRRRRCCCCCGRRWAAAATVWIHEPVAGPDCRDVLGLAGASILGW